MNFKIIISYLSLLGGAILQGTSMALFFLPHSVPSGGAAGFTILFNYWFGLSFGLSHWLVNASLLLFALNYFGKKWTLRTIIAVATTSMTINLFTLESPIFYTNLIFDILIGSVIFGVGIGLLIRARASSGGMVILALIISEYKNWSPGKTLLLVNLLIFVLTSLVIDYRIIIYAIICQIISTAMIDYINRLTFKQITDLAFEWRRK